MVFGFLPSLLKVVIAFVIIAILIFICVRVSYICLNYFNANCKKAGSTND